MSDSDNESDVKVKVKPKSYYSENEHKLSDITDYDIGAIPLPKYETYCPKCKKIPERDTAWVTEEQQAAGVCGFLSYNNIYHGMALPKHCSNGHWWEPNSPKVYTEDQMKDRMLTKLDAGNPRAEIVVGHHDRVLNRWVKTEADKEYFARHGWKAVSLTREEYFGPEAYNKALVETALRELGKTRKKARQLAAYAKKVAATLKNKPKGVKGKKKKT